MNTVCSQDDAGEGQGLDVFSSLIFRQYSAALFDPDCKVPVKLLLSSVFLWLDPECSEMANSCHVKLFICHVYV